MTKDIEAEFRAWWAACGPQGEDVEHPSYTSVTAWALAAWTACASQHTGREAAAHAEGERAATVRIRGLVEVLRLRVRDGIPAWTIADEIRRLQGAIDAGPAVAEVPLPPCLCLLGPDRLPCKCPDGHNLPHVDATGRRWPLDHAGVVAPAPSVVKVRIAVGVCPKGGWDAYGSSYIGNNENAPAQVRATRPSVAVVHWVEAELPLPVSETVKGTVK